ncbi:MAG: NfeD family protein [Lachnospiraceae bacterium]|nr:NfeD family protein [Lachnospiraceae bacterium]MDE7282818.1 NfeD family protein [Lachnospiraceae bacterium]
MSVNMTVFWLAVLVILVVIELFTMGLTTIWFAGGALVAALISIPGLPVSLQIFAFLAVSAVLLYFTRPVAVKYFNRDRVRTNIESMVGRQAIVISEINNLEGVGQVNTGGMEWSARSSYNNVVLPVGAVVTILGVDGVKLIVEERREG